VCSEGCKNGITQGSLGRGRNLGRTVVAGSKNARNARGLWRGNADDRKKGGWITEHHTVAHRLTRGEFQNSAAGRSSDTKRPERPAAHIEDHLGAAVRERC